MSKTAHTNIKKARMHRQVKRKTKLNAFQWFLRFYFWLHHQSTNVVERVPTGLNESRVDCFNANRYKYRNYVLVPVALRHSFFSKLQINWIWEWIGSREPFSGNECINSIDYFQRLVTRKWNIYKNVIILIIDKHEQL